MYNMYLHLLWMAFFIGPQRDYTAPVAVAREEEGGRGEERLSGRSGAALLQCKELARSLFPIPAGKRLLPVCTAKTAYMCLGW